MNGRKLKSKIDDFLNCHKKALPHETGGKGERGGVAKGFPPPALPSRGGDWKTAGKEEGGGKREPAREERAPRFYERVVIKGSRGGTALRNHADKTLPKGCLGRLTRFAFSRSRH